MTVTINEIIALITGMRDKAASDGRALIKLMMGKDPTVSEALMSARIDARRICYDDLLTVLKRLQKTGIN